MKETNKDLVWLIYSFIGSCIVFWLYMFNETVYNFLYRAIPLALIIIIALIGIFFAIMTKKIGG